MLRIVRVLMGQGVEMHQHRVEIGRGAQTTEPQKAPQQSAMWCQEERYDNDETEDENDGWPGRHPRNG